MRSHLLMLSAAGLLAFGGANAHAANRDVTEYLQRANAAATAQLAADGVDVGPGLKVRARVGSDGRLNGVHVAKSSGSIEADAKAAKALKRLRVAQPPILLVGAEVTVTVGPEPIVTATSR